MSKSIVSAALVVAGLLLAVWIVLGYMRERDCVHERASAGYVGPVAASVCN
jgi:hypothetical protein